MGAQVAGKRPLGTVGRVGVVAAMHVAVLFAIAQGLVLKTVDVKPPDIIATVIDKPPIIEPLPPVVGPRLETDPRVYVPAPEFPTEAVESDSAPTVVTTDPPIVQPIIEAGPQVFGARQDARYPLSQPLYPPSDRRAGNEGSGEIEVYVLPNGRIGDARMARSTGFPGLDQSAIEEAKRKWRLQPATRDGVAFAQWYRLRVVFKLQNQ